MSDNNQKQQEDLSPRARAHIAILQVPEDATWEDIKNKLAQAEAKEKTRNQPK